MDSSPTVVVNRHSRHSTDSPVIIDAEGDIVWPVYVAGFVNVLL